MFNLRKMLTNCTGGVTIEYAIVIIPFIITVLFIMELCRVTYIMSSIDLILAEGSGAAASLSDTSSGGDYFKRMIKKQAEQSPLLLSDDIDVITDVSYCQNISQLLDDRCTPTGAESAPLSIYKISVPYKPLFFIFPISFLKDKMSRKVIMVQEHRVIRKDEVS